VIVGIPRIRGLLQPFKPWESPSLSYLPVSSTSLRPCPFQGAGRAASGGALAPEPLATIAFSQSPSCDKFLLKSPFKTSVFFHPALHWLNPIGHANSAIWGGFAGARRAISAFSTNSDQSFMEEKIGLPAQSKFIPSFSAFFLLFFFY